MEIDQQRLKELMRKYREKDISYEEYLELFEYVGNADHKKKVLDLMDDEYKNIKPDADVHDIDWDWMYKNITNSLPERKIVPGYWKYFAAACALLIFGLGIYKYITPDKQLAINTEYRNDVLPAGDKAILELGDGSKVFLNDIDEGILAKQGNTAIKKTTEGELVYDASALEDDGDKVVFNTISTPRGGRYHVILPDGTKVWLNAASSLRFPTSFKGNERRVSLSGEAYFEVAKNKEMPFFVAAGKSEIKVLGTQFNIMSYASESISQTTLVEGSIQYTNQTYQHVLSPGEQAFYNNSSGKVQILKVNSNDFIAWKNGLFVFNNTSIKTIMKDISRWYDVDVIYTEDAPDVYFTGVIPRSVNVSKVLKVLQNAGDVDFGIDGKLITCSRKINKNDAGISK